MRHWNVVLYFIYLSPAVPTKIFVLCKHRGRHSPWLYKQAEWGLNGVGSEWKPVKSWVRAKQKTTTHYVGLFPARHETIIMPKAELQTEAARSWVIPYSLIHSSPATGQSTWNKQLTTDSNRQWMWGRSTWNRQLPESIPHNHTLNYGLRPSTHWENKTPILFGHHLTKKKLFLTFIKILV